MEVYRQLLEPRADAAELLQPADALLGDATAPVRDAVEPHRRVVAGVLVVLVRDDRLDLLPRQPVAHAPDAVAFVAGELPGLAATASSPASASDQERDRLPDDRFGPRRFVDLSSGDFDGEGSALTVSDHVELRSKPAAAAAQRVVGGLVLVPLETFLSAPAAARAARTDEPSTHHNSQSMYPSVSSFTCSVSTTAAKTPLLRQLRKWSYTVCQGPKRSGRSRQGAPVARTQKMPLSCVRRSLAGRPVRAVLSGRCGSTNAHCSSVSSWRFMRENLRDVTEAYHAETAFSDRA
jgi:hypothetical protein